MNLAGLIEALRALPPESTIFVDYTGKAPGRLCSWRGRYNELTIDTEPWDEDNRCLTVGALLVDANLAVGRTFEGYKGGDFTMDATTPVWCDPYGEYKCRAIVEIVMDGDTARIRTFDASDYA